MVLISQPVMEYSTKETFLFVEFVQKMNNVDLNSTDEWSWSSILVFCFAWGFFCFAGGFVCFACNNVPGPNRKKEL